MTDHEKVLEMLRIKDQAPLSIEPMKSALIVVDAQRWFARPDYSFAQVLEKIVPGTTAGVSWKRCGQRKRRSVHKHPATADPMR